MPFLPEHEIKSKGGISLAPMIDFLFLMLVFFASLAISRITTKDTEIDLVKVNYETASPTVINSSNEYPNDLKIINITISKESEYQWVTDIRDYKINSANEVKEELIKQYKRGLLPEDMSKTQVMLKIDKNAKWEPILKLIFAVRDAGFEVHPLYEPEDEDTQLSDHTTKYKTSQIAPL
jgi:biopolymer transport protein ExbD